jgi:hypothetical protein
VRSEVSVAVDDSDPRDPAARCDRCGRQGTIARAVHHTDPPSVLRYCGACWPVAQEELEERQREEQEQSRMAHEAWVDTARHNPQAARPAPPPPAGWSSASRSWHDVRRFLTLIAQPPNGGPAPTSGQLAAIAAEIRAAAIEMDGPMPPDVEEFIAEHLPPSA